MVVLTRCLSFILLVTAFAGPSIARAQLLNIELLGVSITAPVNDVLADINLLGGITGGGELLGVEVLGSDNLLGLSVSGQDILLLGAPVGGTSDGGDLSVLTGTIDTSQGAVLEFLQDTAMGDINPTVLTLSLPGSDGQGSPDVDTSKDKETASTPEILAGVASTKLGACVDKDRDSVCDSDDQCLNSPAGAMVLPSGCHFDRAKPLALQGVSFGVGTAVLVDSSTEILRKVAQMIQFMPRVMIEVAGHTDDVGSSADNQVLSERRALAVKNYLVAAGVSPQQLVVKGYGESRPLVLTSRLSAKALTDARSRNRRVELQVLDGRPKP
ncbi:OmpA family protein [Zhongshania arctica]|uniref:OmpA family protein n=1 Tax=Zhongshania arctica TaxID=3238302 RepID=A0ABV3TVL2_9GAMM